MLQILKCSMCCFISTFSIYFPTFLLVFFYLKSYFLPTFSHSYAVQPSNVDCRPHVVFFIMSTLCLEIGGDVYRKYPVQSEGVRHVRDTGLHNTRASNHGYSARRHHKGKSSSSLSQAQEPFKCYVMQMGVGGVKFS